MLASKWSATKARRIRLSVVIRDGGAAQVPGHFQAYPKGYSPLPMLMRCSIGLGAADTGTHSRFEKSTKFHAA